MKKATSIKHTLVFKRASGTSRGILTEKPAYFIVLRDNDHVGIGECSLLPGLSIDDRPDFENKLDETLENWMEGIETDLTEWPSISFGMETAGRSLKRANSFELFESPFLRGERGIEINGLVWMGSKSEMRERVKEKLNKGYRCAKLKIGAIDFDDEIELLKSIRKNFTPDEIEIRVDANGAFTPETALEKLKRLSEFELHSIEQPIRQGQWDSMAELCESTPLDIALDEELIGIRDTREMARMLNTIRPQAIVIKPGLVGGLDATADWIKAAEETGAYHWLTSALESNIGLNAIAQYTDGLAPRIPQGLGTGELYLNNIESPLFIEGRYLKYNPSKEWQFPYKT